MRGAFPSSLNEFIVQLINQDSWVYSNMLHEQKHYSFIHFRFQMGPRKGPSGWEVEEERGLQWENIATTVTVTYMELMLPSP